jgi:hypothetical protein
MLVATRRRTLGAGCSFSEGEYLEGGVDVLARDVDGSRGRGQLAASREMAEHADDAGASLENQNSHGL